MTTALLAVACCLSAAWWVPQAARAVRTSTDGVSATTWALSAANTGTWTVWALCTGRPAVAAVEAAQTLGAAVVVAATDRRRLWLPGAAGVPLAALAALRPTWSGPAAVVVALTVRVPQLWRLCRGDEPAGVSASTWWLSAAAKLAWLAWALAAGATAMVWGAGVAAATSAAVAATVRRRRTTC